MIKLFRKLGRTARYVLLVVTFFGCFLARGYRPDWAPVAQRAELAVFTAAAVDVLWMLQQWVRRRCVAIRQRWKAFQRLTDEAPQVEAGASDAPLETVSVADVGSSV
ncbi:hypothetical protein [Kitasatospora sp. NPDC004289]